MKNEGKEFFDASLKIFKVSIQKTFDNHIEPVWRSTEILLYIIAGPPKLAHQLIMLLQHVDQCDGGHDEVRGMFRFPMNKIVKLNYLDAVIDVRECLEWLTSKADLWAMCNSNMVLPHFDLFVKMAENEVNIYNNSTWTSEYEYNNLATLFHIKICCVSSQGQKIESIVQMMSLNLKNNRGEACRS